MALSSRIVNVKDRSRREVKFHGTTAFPCAAYEYSLTDRPGDVIPWHWHDEMEAITITEGEMELRVTSRRVFLRPGELALINTDVLHFARAVKGLGNCTLESFVFSEKLIAGDETSIFETRYLTPLCQYPKFICMHVYPGKWDFEGFQEAMEAMKADKPGYEFAVRGVLSHIILDAWKHYETSLSLPQHPDTNAKRISAMLDYIHTHYAENLTVAQIGSAVHIGERETLRCFKETIGESPTQYLLKYRLMQSADLLRNNPDESIASIALQCGFNSPSYYTKKFHEVFQCTPREYPGVRRSG